MTRHDAIKHLSYKIAYCKSTWATWADRVNVDALELAVRALGKPEQKTGTWQWSFNGKAILIQCSECGLHYDSWAAGFNYCPNCGAKMEE